MKDTRPSGYPGTLAEWERQCEQQARADREVLRAMEARYDRLNREAITQRNFRYHETANG